MQQENSSARRQNGAKVNPPHEPRPFARLVRNGLPKAVQIKVNLRNRHSARNAAPAVGNLWKSGLLNQQSHLAAQLLLRHDVAVERPGHQHPERFC